MSKVMDVTGYDTQPKFFDLPSDITGTAPQNMKVVLLGSVQEGAPFDFVVKVTYPSGMSTAKASVDAAKDSQADVVISGQADPKGSEMTKWFIIYTDGLSGDWEFNFQITQVGGTSTYTFKKKRDR